MRIQPHLENAGTIFLFGSKSQLALDRSLNQLIAERSVDIAAGQILMDVERVGASRELVLARPFRSKVAP